MTSVTENGQYDLPTVASCPSDITITWTSNDASVVVGTDGKITVTLDTTAKDVKVTATVTSTLGTVTNNTKEFTLNLAKGVLTIEEALEYTAADPDKVLYYVTGTIDEVSNTTYGNVWINDGNGNRIYVYGLDDEDGNQYNQMTVKPVKGDTIKILCWVGYYGSAPQLADAIVVEHTLHGDNHVYSTLSKKCDLCDAIAEHQHVDTATVDNVCDLCGEMLITYSAETGTVSVTHDGTTYYVGAYSESWVLASTDSTEAATITLYISSDSKYAKIKIGDTFIAPTSGNKNGITEGEYVWALTVNADNTYTFCGQDSDTTTLAFNGTSTTLKIRSYRNSTLTGNSASSYTSQFTFTPSAS